MKCVLVVRAEDAVARSRAKRLGCELVVAGDWQIRGDATLFIAPGTLTPWDLVAAGFHFMVRWDAAAPLWRYGVTAENVGTPAERKRTQGITRDLRIPVYAPELLFVRNSADGQRLVKTWRKECEGKADERLAFVRALYIIKPRFCVLPRTWLADVAKRAEADHKAWIGARADHKAWIGARAGHRPSVLVKVQIGPNQFVKCRPGDEDAVLQRLKRIMGGRKRG